MDKNNNTGEASSLAPVRIWLCGAFRMQCGEGTTERMELSAETLPHRKDVSQALSLLKLLLCQPERQAHRDWIMEQFWPESAQSTATHRLENVASTFRQIFHPWEHEPLLRSINSTRKSGILYRLPAYPHLWVDVDAIQWNIEQAARMERFANDSLPYWQRAFDLLTRGSFLADEPYAEWAKEPRERFDGFARQCVHALSRLYVQRYGAAGKAEALLLLRTYWQQHKTDEDALRPLLELLVEQECYQEAEEYYEQARETLEQDGRKLDPKTRDVMEFVRALQIQREHTFLNIAKSTGDISKGILHLPSPKHTTSSNAYSFTNYNTSLELEDFTDTSSSLPSLFRADADAVSNASILLSKSSIVNEREITYFDQQTQLYWRAREETALPTTTLYAHVMRHIDDINLLLVRLHSPLLRLYLCEIMCKTVLLAGMLLYDMGKYEQARQRYQVAYQAAMEANNAILQALVWGWMSFTWTYTEHYTEALRCVQYARSFAMQTTNRITQAWLSAIEAEVQAHLHNHDACLQALSDMEQGMGTSPSQDTSYLFEFNPVLLLGYKGICLQQLYQRQDPTTYDLLQEAKVSLEQALTSNAPIKRKLYYLNDLAGVYARQEEVETACNYIIQGIPLMVNVGSGSKTIRKHLLQVRMLLQPYEHTSFVRRLDEQIAFLLIER